MKQGRETTQEDRIAIAKDSLENGCNYGETGATFEHCFPYDNETKTIQNNLI